MKNETSRVWRRALLAAALLAVSMTGPANLVRAADKVTAGAVQLEDAFSAVAQRAFPAVVVVTNKQVGGGRPMYRGLPPELERFFGIPMPQPRLEPRDGPKVPQPVGQGSGVVISEDGYVVTNYHVIQDHDALAVKLRDGRVFDSARDPKAVTVVGVDQETDLALLKIGNGELDPLPTLPFADSDKVRVGQWAIAVGAPFRLDYSVTVGVVSQKGRHDLHLNTYENYIQTDASINPGNSGGPLLNIHGEIIGINDFIMTGGAGSRGNIGLGFAIASNLVRQVVEDLKEHGEVVRPWLGIAMQEMTPELKDQFGVTQGVLIAEVMEGEPAEAAGLKAGDVILKVGDKEVRTPHDVQLAVLAYAPGDEISFLLSREGDEVTVNVRARRKDGPGPAPKIASKEQLLNTLGLYLEEDDDGVIVAGVVGDSPAAAAGLRQGDRVLSVNRTPIQTVEDFVDVLQESGAGTAMLYVDRRGRRSFVVIEYGGDQE